MKSGVAVYGLTRFCENFVFHTAVEVAIVTLVSSAFGGGPGGAH